MYAFISTFMSAPCIFYMSRACKYCANRI